MTKPAPWKIVTVCLFLMAIMGAAVMVVVSMVDTNPTDMAGAKPDQPSTAALAPSYAPLAQLAPATTQSTNAADSYFAAFRLFEQLGTTPADIELFGKYEESNLFDDRAADLFDRYAMIASSIRLGAAMKSCDWGQPSIGDRTQVFNDMRAVAIFMVLRARYEAQTNDKLAASDDLIATIAFSRHIDSRALLINKLVAMAIEQLAIEPLTELLPALPKQRLQWLAKQLDDLPPLTTGKQLLQGEYDTALQMALNQNQPMQIEAIKSLEDFYHAVGDAMDQSPQAFEMAVDEQVAKLGNGTMAQALANPLVSSLRRMHRTIVESESRRIALREAIDALAR